MRFLLPILLLFVPLFSAPILNYEFYPRSDRFDLMITFAKKYEGELNRINSDKKIIITLKDTTIFENVKKSFDNNLIKGVSIGQAGKDTVIVFDTLQTLNMTASKSAEGTGLRIRLKEDVAKKQNSTVQAPAKEPILKPLIDDKKEEPQAATFKEDNTDMSRYFAVIAILFVLIAILLYVKKRFTSKDALTRSAWLFGAPVQSENMKVVFQKQLDIKNRVVVFEVGDIRFTVLIGQNSSTLLDKKEIAPKKGGGFDAILDDSEEKLNSYLKLENKRVDDARFESYKKRAAILGDD